MGGWNGGGTFSRTHNWQQDQANGIAIRADRHDANDVDFVNGINNCLTKDGQNSPSADLPMATQKHTNVGKATALNQYATAEQVVDNELKYYTATGTDTYVITPNPAITAYAAGQSFYVNFTNANTGAATINVNSLGARDLVKGASTALASGDIVAGKIYEIVDDGTRFQVKDVASAVADGSITTAKLANDAVDADKLDDSADFTMNSLTTDLISAETSAGVVIEAANGTDVMNAGAGNTANATFYGNVSMNTTGKIVNMADPTSAQDAATKAYVDTNGGTNLTGRNILAWVNFNGTGTVAIRDSYNVSSITDNGAGDYTINFTNTLSNANYAVFGMTTISSGVFSTFVGKDSSVAPTTSAITVNLKEDSGSLVDRDYVYILVIGD